MNPTQRRARQMLDYRRDAASRVLTYLPTGGPVAEVVLVYAPHVMRAHMNAGESNTLDIIYRFGPYVTVDFICRKRYISKAAAERYVLGLLKKCYLDESYDKHAKQPKYNISDPLLWAGLNLHHHKRGWMPPTVDEVRAFLHSLTDSVGQF